MLLPELKKIKDIYQACCAKRRCPRTPKRATEANLDSALVESALVFVVPKIVAGPAHPCPPPTTPYIKLLRRSQFLFSGQGDSALFGINGFNLLVDGGFSRRACFWDFSRHLDRLDAILITRVSDDNTGGMSALLQV